MSFFPRGPDRPASQSGIERGMLRLRVAGPHEIHVDLYECARPSYALLLVHGTAGHGGCYADYAPIAASLGAHVYALDLQGHGRSGGERGVFTMDGFLADVDAVARLVKQRTGLPVVLLGASQGGEVAFHALGHSSAVAGAVCMNILLSAELPMNRRIAWMRGQAARALAALAGDRLRVPLRQVIDFEAAYREDPDLCRAKDADPLYVWSYGFASYRSIFAYTPPRTAAANQKPVLVACGEDDPIVGVEHCRAAFDRIGGPKSFYSMPHAGHQLMLFHSERFARLVDSWVRDQILGRRASGWTPPCEPEREQYLAFVDEQNRDSPAPEPEYRLSLLDRALCAVENGSIPSGVRFFAEGRETKFGRFVSDVVSKIDLAAWQVFAPALPAPPPDRAPRMAVFACGQGTALARLLESYPELRRWHFDGIDVDSDAVQEARRRFAGAPNVSVRAADARDPAAIEPASYDVVYAHGIFDHCTGHRAILANAHRALRPGGKLFYVLPDRNLATWLAFVSAGPRWVFPLGHYKDIHDYRRFAKPREMDSLLRTVGFEPGPQRGVEYAPWPITIGLGVRRRDASALHFHLTRPRWWLGGGYNGEYCGIATKPFGSAA